MPIRATAFLIEPSSSISSNRRARPSPSFVRPPKTTQTLMRGCTGAFPGPAAASARRSSRRDLTGRRGPLGAPGDRAPESWYRVRRQRGVEARPQPAGKPAVVEPDDRVVAGRQLRRGPGVPGARAPVVARLGGVEDDEVAPVAVGELERAVAQDPRVSGQLLDQLVVRPRQRRVVEPRSLDGEEADEPEVPAGAEPIRPRRARRDAAARPAPGSRRRGRPAALPAIPGGGPPWCGGRPGRRPCGGDR